MLIVRIFLLPVNSVPAHNKSNIIFLCLRPLLPFGVPFAFTYKSSGSKCRLKTCLCLQSSLATGYPRDKIQMQMWCFLIQMNISTNHINMNEDEKAAETAELLKDLFPDFSYVKRKRKPKKD